MILCHFPAPTKSRGTKPDKVSLSTSRFLIGKAFNSGFFSLRPAAGLFRFFVFLGENSVNITVFRDNSEFVNLR
ncbi:hypothetical protein CYPRO_1826 [Cyclonatronum proteinivorum]|uniref:Uncharacterized protein n=1 Tax=Cyclonatronum proteinivorum TaxID=1457365 RepID=A0A345UKS4_9BACT|nr:hypothetical protein CYPRO_1826 [Cyclonatronum proteinivorum]